MANSAPALVSLSTRQQVMLERLKAGNIKGLESFLKDAAKAIRDRLASDELTALARSRAEAQLVAIRNDLQAIYGDAGKQITSDLKDLADYATGAEARALDAVLSGVELTVPSANQVLAAAMSRPLTSGQSAKMLEPFINDWVTGSIEKVENAIRLGYMQGRTNRELIADVVGTASNKYKDGMIDATYRNAQAVVRTSVQHVAQVARSETWAQNADIITGYEWVSTLDSRTTVQCQSLDGRVFEIGKGPLPPIHINCRSSTAPVIANKFIRDTLRKGATRVSNGDTDGPVSAGTSYYEWLKTQPASFQDEALGVGRAQLFRDGGLSAQRFQELQLGKQFEPLTLDQMKELEPVAFERAGL